MTCGRHHRLVLRCFPQVIKPGEGVDTYPQLGDLVTIRCAGYLNNFSKVDACDEITFVLGDNDTLQGKD